MKRSWLWLVVLLLVVFGIGWQSSRLSARDAAPAGSGADRDFRGFGSRGSPFGNPFFRSPEQLAGELGMDEKQRAALEAILADSARRINDYADAIHQVKEGARHDVLAILSADQRRTLERKYEEMLERRSKESIANGLEWLRENAALDEPTMRRAETILAEYEARKRALMLPSYGPTAPAGGDLDATDDAIDELRAARDAKVAEFLDPATLERFRTDVTRWRGKGSSHGGSRPSGATERTGDPKPDAPKPDAKSDGSQPDGSKP
jgi:hypothetical protein